LLATFPAEQFVGAVRDHLVQVHVGLGAGAGLPDNQRKLSVELAVDHVLRRLDDRARALAIDEAERLVHLGGGAFDEAERADQWQGHALLADAEVLPRTLRLRAPVFVRRDRDRAERVGFGASFRHDGPAYAEMSGRSYFFRNRSSRTTSAPPEGLFGSGLS